MTTNSLLDGLLSISTHGSVLVEVVADDDDAADPRIPKGVLEMLGPQDVLISKVGHMMYIRQAHWDRIKHHFKAQQIS